MDTVEIIEELFESLGELSGIILLILGIILLITALIALVVYIFNGLGYMKLAKKLNITHGWFAFIPVLSNYLLGEIGFEYFCNDKKEYNQYMKWILAGLPLVYLVIPALSTVSSLAVIVISVIAYINMYKILKPNNEALYVIGSALGFSGIILYFTKLDNINDAYVSENVNDETKEEVKKGTKYCSNCGSKMDKNAKFCPKCGKNQ